jgi:hypothetical protein
LKNLERAQREAGELFDEGATWERKFAGLEEACGTGTGLNKEAVARLYWVCKRFFDTGLPALVSVQESVQECEHCRRAIDLPYAILGSNLKHMRDVLHDTGASMPDLCLTIKET